MVDKVLLTLILLLIPTFGISLYNDSTSHLSGGRAMMYAISVLLFIISVSLYVDLRTPLSPGGDAMGNGLARGLTALAIIAGLSTIWLIWFLYFAFTKDFIKVGVLIGVLFLAFLPDMYDTYKVTIRENIISLFHKTYPLHDIDIITKYIYPIKILDFNITYQNGEKCHLYSNGGRGDNRTKESSSSFSLPHKKNLLIEKLSIYYFSYIDNTFYQLDGDLPLVREEEILKIMKREVKGRWSWIAPDINIYPKGEIGVSFKVIPLSSDEGEKLITLQANTVEGDWKLITENSSLSREEYIKKFLKNTDEDE